MHVEAFAEWLNFRLEQQEKYIRPWLHWLGRTPEDAANLLKRAQKAWDGEGENPPHCADCRERHQPTTRQCLDCGLGCPGEQMRLMNPEIVGNAHGPGIDGTDPVRFPRGKASVDNGSGTW